MDIQVLTVDTAAAAEWAARKERIDIPGLEAMAAGVRRSVVTMVDRAGLGHIGGDLSVTDILVTLFGAVLDVDPTDPQRPDRDRFVQEALAGLADVTLALVGIGALEPSSLLQSSGNIFSEPELEALGAQGAVGDICLRFFDAGGERVESDVDRRVIGVSLEQLREADRSVGIAGGPRKYEAILGALRGGWINVLITDSTTAERLLAEPTT